MDRAHFDSRNGTSDTCDALPHFLYPSISSRAIKHNSRNIGPADSSQFWIFPYPPYPGMNTFRLGRFTIGSLNRERLVYRCNKMGCNYFDRYPNQFFNRFAIEGAPVSVQVFDWSY